MIKKLCLRVLTLWLILPVALNAQQPLDSVLPIRGFCIGAPSVKDVDRFVKFIDEELASRKVNTLILRVDYNYQYTSPPGTRLLSMMRTHDCAPALLTPERIHFSNPSA